MESDAGQDTRGVTSRMICSSCTQIRIPPQYEDEAVVLERALGLSYKTNPTVSAKSLRQSYREEVRYMPLRSTF